MKKNMSVYDWPDLIFTVRKTLEKPGGGYEIIPVKSDKICPELFNQLKNNPLWKNIPIIFLTVRQDMINSGGFLGDGHNEKPFEADDLKRTINKITKK